MSRKMKPICVQCRRPFSAKRANAGYHLCLICGEQQAQKRKHTIVSMHKSNCIPITDLEDLKGIGNKGGLYH